MNDINQLKHFDALDYVGEYFTNELKDGEEFLYSTIKIQDDSKVTFLCKYDSKLLYLKMVDLLVILV